jgi:hypothetical protein
VPRHKRVKREPTGTLIAASALVDFSPVPCVLVPLACPLSLPILC